MPAAMLMAFAMTGGQGASRTNGHTAFRVESVTAATKSLRAADIWPLAASETRFAISGDNAAGQGTTHIVQRAASDFGATVAIEESGYRTEYLSRDDDGGIRLHAVHDETEHALTLFEPPLLLAPSLLQPGEPVESEAKMRILDARDRGKQRERGAATRTMTYTHDARLQVGQREVVAAQLEIHFTADLRFADADERTTMFVTRDGGLIVQHSEEKVTILGAFPRTRQRTLVRGP
jgi:hypothetical protein